MSPALPNPFTGEAAPRLPANFDALADRMVADIAEAVASLRDALPDADAPRRYTGL